ncbi:hypothetical protein SAY87_027610 [Trapa incisa]|uniref:LOB domain-containing protein n=1 Tax=Trapa incisa TaxID=236973 RepID=A0AAN7JMP1_9MYRT|nr:hypothetical protein SAY87_027610 [Trapa incisa]
MGGNSACASCKLLRRRCANDCIFAPYFPSDDPHRFAIVHKELRIHQRADAVNSLVYEANSRVRDPVYGCLGAISYLQNQVAQLQMQLAVVQAEIICILVQQEPMIVPSQPPAAAMEAGMMDGPMDDKSGLGGFLHSNVLPSQYLSFASSSNVTPRGVSQEGFLPWP